MANCLISRTALKWVALLSIFLTMGLSMEAKVTESVFGKTPDGKSVEIYTLEDGAIRVRVMSYGARIVSLEAPGRDGKVADVVLGYDTLAPYLTDTNYFGATVGRYANRIAHGEFSLDGKQYQLSTNEHGNTLHGGKDNFSSRLWQGRRIPNGVEFTLTSPNGDQGFPGTLTAHVRFTLEKGNLTIDYSATTDKDTVVNLINHSYFNLKGEGQGSILDHVLTINADRYTPTNAQLIPTGQIEPVAGTPFDFRKPNPVGARIHADNEQLHLAGGYDQNFVLNGQPGQLKEAGRVLEPESGRVLTVKTTQPGLQFYSGNFLNGVPGKHGHVYRKNDALCLETQHFPDSPNHPNFPSAELKPGEVYHQVTVYSFSIQQ